MCSVALEMRRPPYSTAGLKESPVVQFCAPCVYKSLTAGQNLRLRREPNQHDAEHGSSGAQRQLLTTTGLHQPACLRTRTRSSSAWSTGGRRSWRMSAAATLRPSRELSRGLLPRVRMLSIISAVLVPTFAGPKLAFADSTGFRLHLLSTPRPQIPPNAVTPHRI